MKDVIIGGCVIRIWHADFLQTLFPGGAALPSAPNYRPEDRTTAAELGYGEDDAGCYRMWQEHDPLHSFTAVQEGLDFSPTLWHAATQRKPPPGLMRDEEDRVKALQQLLNGVPADPAHVAQLVGRTGQSQGALVDAARVWLASIWG